MDKSILAVIFFSLFSSAIFAQYFQQEVNYKINVQLNDTAHTLDGFIEIEYTNNSPDELNYIMFHLWPNAYKNNQTAFAKQQLENKNTNFWFSKKEDKGYIDKLDFRVYGANVQWALDSVHIDIAKINLTQPLKPKEKIIITTPFFVKIPKTFSRLGHEEQSYQITQWFPKPAVYDKNGWNAMPYLDQGEFYSEYGSFEVKITLPKNYVVGATGYLQNEAEQQWMDSIAEKTATLNEMQLRQKLNPVSASETKTLKYKIDDVHDFAWFADKRYRILKSEIELPESKRKVTTYAMFTHVEAKLWKDATKYINQGVQAYSKWVGEYPYDICTAVQGALSAGGGMEYPTITIIGKAGNARALETVIIHEVGHNWFQGILGNNERVHPWMDEGINSFYEQRYIQEYYPEDMLIGKNKGINRFLNVETFKADEFLKLAYEAVASYRAAQPLGKYSEVYTSNNFGVIVYGKGGWAMQYLQGYLGDSVFDIAMQNYFNEFKFKHPQPEDLKSVLEAASGKDLDWFFNTLLNTNEDANYKIASIKKQDDTTFNVHIKNKGENNYPISAGTYNFKENQYTTQNWLDGFLGDTTITLSKPNKKSMFCLDCEKEIPSLHRNNFYKRKPLSLKFFAAYDRPNRTEIFFTPWIGWNNYDKNTLGIALYNHSIPNKKFTYELVPQYAFGTKTIVGMGRIAYSWFLQDSKIHNINFGVQGRRFSWQQEPRVLTYNKIQPTLTLDIAKKNLRSHINRTLVLRNINILQETDFFNIAEGRRKKELQHYYVNEAAFYYENLRAINPISWSAHLQQGAEFVKLFAEANFKISYKKKNEGFNIRYFIGGFPWENISNGNVPDPRLRMNYSSGFGPFVKDYTYDEFLLGRSDFGGFYSQQIVIRDGGFKTLTNIGQTNSWLASLNLSSDIPTRLPFKPFIGIGAYGDANSKFNFAFEAGITIFVVRDIIELHLPLTSFIQADFGTGKETYKWNIAMKQNDADNVNRGKKYRNLLTFTLNLNKLNPFTAVKKMAL